MPPSLATGSRAFPHPLPLNTRLGGYQSRSGRFAIQQRHLSLQEIERFTERTAGSLVTMLTELSQQSHNVTVLISTKHAGNVRFARVSYRKIKAPVLEAQICVHYTELWNIQGEAKVRKHMNFCLLELSWPQ